MTRPPAGEPDERTGRERSKPTPTRAQRPRLPRTEPAARRKGRQGLDAVRTARIDARLREAERRALGR